MPAKELVQNLPATVRRWFFAAYALIGVGIGATQVGFSAAELGQPTWLVVALAVYAFIGGAFGLTAATNVNARPVTMTEVDATPVPEDYQPRYRAEPDATTGPHNTTP
jgi:hypothetical protein